MPALDAHLIASLVAGVVVLPGLLCARWQTMPAGLRAALAPLSAGILLWLLLDLGDSALEAVILAFKSGRPAHVGASLALVLVGVAVGRLAFAGRVPMARAGAAVEKPVPDLALMSAAGIGVHHLGKVLALGPGSVDLGAALFAGGILTQALGGLAIAGRERSANASWKRIILLALVCGGPALLAALVGRMPSSGSLALLCASLAMGMLVGVVRLSLVLPPQLSLVRVLPALTVGMLAGPILSGPWAKTWVATLVSGPITVAASPRNVEVTIRGGHFVPATLALAAGATIVVKNEDAKDYTLEGAGILYGDVPVAAASTRAVSPMGEPGAYTINVEEDHRMLLPVRVSGAPSRAAVAPDTVARALAAQRQPVVFADTHTPAYAAYTRFNLTIRGEHARAEVLDRLNEIARAVSSTWLPQDLGQYFTPSAWAQLRPSVAMVVGLGPECYDSARFGTHVAASRPRDLHAITYSAALGFDARQTQRDLLVRVTSDSMWSNQQVCRYVWRQLAGRIADRTLECGYANPNGRSPILGGFFDGTGNPIGEDRDKAVFLTGEQRGGTYMACFRIRFDQERFESHSLAQQQAIIGRVHASGRQLPHDRASSHRAKAEGDSSRTILRQGMVYDDGPDNTGLLFASVQASLTEQFEGILRGFMMNKAAPSAGTGPDQLLDYMHFEEGGGTASFHRWRRRTAERVGST